MVTDEAGVPVAEVIPIKGWRRVMAERMLSSHLERAQVTQMREVDGQALADLRRSLLERPDRANGARVTYTHLLMLALAKALREHPLLNSGVVDEEIHVYGEVNVAVAVALPDGALVAPVVRQVDALDLAEVARRTIEITEKARARRVRPGELAGGTVTLTNAGMYGTDFVTPLISAGQNIALGVGRMVAKPVVAEDRIVVRQRLGLSLAYDHRVLTGAVAARFFQTLEAAIADPSWIR